MHMYFHVCCRYFVLHKLPGLTFLDSRAVSSVKRKEAKRVGAFMRVVRPPDDTVSLHTHYTLLAISAMHTVSTHIVVTVLL